MDKKKLLKGKEKAKRMTKAVWTVCMILAVTVLFVTPVFADTDNDASNMVIFTGTKALIAAATLGLTGLIAGFGGFFSIKAGIEWHAAEDEEKGRKKKNFIMTFIISVFVTCAPSILTWVLGFYK